MENLNEKGRFNNIWDEKVDEHSYKKINGKDELMLMDDDGGLDGNHG
jgi:hypothetical protein